MAKVLLVDSYDSYTFNLYQLVLDVSPLAEIVVIRNDQLASDQLDQFISCFDFIVIGPGPGDPRNKHDIGFIQKLFEYDVPILGVCLGFQLICMNAGARIERMSTVKHGQVSRLHTVRSAIYLDDTTFSVTRYHSLCARDIQVSGNLVEIGWVEDAADNGHVTMSVMHTTKPYVGLQYHPESACSEQGRSTVQNFIKYAEDWNREHRVIANCASFSTIQRQSIRPRALAESKIAKGTVEWRELATTLPVQRIAELLSVQTARDFILLDAAAEPSRYSIIAALTGKEQHLNYSVGQSSWTFGKHTATAAQHKSVWHFIAEVMQARKCEIGPVESPFWGGFAGYLSYESGVETLDVLPIPETSTKSDINLIFVERSIVIDQKSNKMYVQSIKCHGQSGETDSAWINDMCSKLEIAMNTPPTSPPVVETINTAVDVELPKKSEYLDSISRAQEYLAEGQSYELCLTAPTRISCQAQNPWAVYQSLRRRNPSPFASYMKLSGMHLLSSSPERFLSWTRNGSCEFRPIKGTVRKTPGMTRQKAEAILRDPKEIAENLMIVDLIRHDLHQLAKNVDVVGLMQVEEYHTVFQLVSVIVGTFDAPFTGLDILSKSLPPGSMTGAPKKRSVELLQLLEGRRRGIYSGVCGYLSVCGGGDWSVIIRSAFRYECDNDCSSDTDVWWIGAGGAITALSDPLAEWEEMLTKLQSTLPCFGADGHVG